MDVLSEVLRTVRLEGALFFNGEFSAPWCIQSTRSSEIAPYLFPQAGHLIIFHLLTEGRAYARLLEGRQEDLAAGDIVVFPHGDAHLLGQGSPMIPVDALPMFRRHFSRELKLARWGGGGETTRFVCGFMACDPRLSEVFLTGLPNMLIVHAVDDPSNQWLEQSIRFSANEVGENHPGSGLVLAKLSEVLFVETLRRYINALPSDRTGWLAGLRDPAIGRALALLHKEPAHPWTVTDLGRHIGLSRTLLAERFRHFLGTTPMAYLAQWRLKLGAEKLRSTESSISEIAEAVGYGSEAAFNRAFKREFGGPPAQFRRDHKSATA